MAKDDKNPEMFTAKDVERKSGTKHGGRSALSFQDGEARVSLVGIDDRDVSRGTDAQVKAMEVSIPSPNVTTHRDSISVKTGVTGIDVRQAEKTTFGGVKYVESCVKDHPEITKKIFEAVKDVTISNASMAKYDFGGEAQAILNIKHKTDGPCR